jgi:hypothetical protein
MVAKVRKFLQSTKQFTQLFSKEQRIARMKRKGSWGLRDTISTGNWIIRTVPVIKHFNRIPGLKIVNWLER